MRKQRLPLCPLDNVVGFIDRISRRIARSTEAQRLFFFLGTSEFMLQNKFPPDEMFAPFFGPLEGRCHDAGIVRDSGILAQLAATTDRSGGGVYSVYGVYPLCQHFLCLFKGAALTEQQAFNTAMSRVRQCVELRFQKKTVGLFAFIDPSKNQVPFQPVGCYTTTAAILTNCHTTLHESETGQYQHSANCSGRIF